MRSINASGNNFRWKHRNSVLLTTYFRWSKIRWCILGALFSVFIVQFIQIRSVTYPIFFQMMLSTYFPNTFGPLAEGPETTTEPPEVVVEMNDRSPTYKIVVRGDDRTYADPDQAQTKLLENLQLYETCQRDPTTVVVQIGAYLGDFGLYAAACGCQVFIFEPQPSNAKLINSSIRQNEFPTFRVHLFNLVVNDLPSNSTVQYPPGDGTPSALDDPAIVQTVQLDDILWPTQSIFILKVDAEGFELNVFRSAKNLFAQKRIRHLIFKFYPWLIDRGSQKTLLPYVKKELKAKFIYNHYRTEPNIYGPLRPRDVQLFYDQHVNTDLPTDVYAAMDDSANRNTVKAQRYQKNKNVAF